MPSDEELNILCAEKIMGWESSGDWPTCEECRGSGWVSMPYSSSDPCSCSNGKDFSPLIDPEHLDMLVDQMVDELKWAYSFSCSHWHVDGNMRHMGMRVFRHEARFVNGPDGVTEEGDLGLTGLKVQSVRSGPKVVDKDKRRARVLAALRAVGAIE